MCRHVCLVSWLLSSDLVIYSSFGYTAKNCVYLGYINLGNTLDEIGLVIAGIY